MKIVYKNSDGNKILMYVNGNYVGQVIVMDRDEPAIYISHLSILEKEQNKGYGTQILKDIFVNYNTKEAVSLHVDCENESALRLYRRLGFFISGVAEKTRKIKKHYLMTKRIYV